jgi:hypothetical protein
LPLLEWTIVRLVVSENHGRRHNNKTEPQEERTASPLRTRRQRSYGLRKTTFQKVGLNAEKTIGIQPVGRCFLLTFSRLIVHLGLNGVHGRSIRTAARLWDRRAWRGAQAGKRQSNRPRSLLQRQRQSEEGWRLAGRGSGWRLRVFPRTRGVLR